MKPSFGTCIFKLREKPVDCRNGADRSRQCAASDWELVSCFMAHYGNLLVADAPIRLIDAFTHIIVDNENEVFGEEGADVANVLTQIK